jgi:hypothetical protein
MRHHALLPFVMIAVLPFASSAQRLDLLPEPITRQISEEISGDAAFAHIRHNSQFHRPRGGSDGLWKVAQYYEEKAREYGLTDVKIIKQKYGTTRPWNAKSGELWIAGDQPERIASTIQTPLHLADFSRKADVTAELIDIGTGTAAELEGKNVTGKIVLTSALLLRSCVTSWWGRELPASSGIPVRSTRAVEPMARDSTCLIRLDGFLFLQGR